MADYKAIFNQVSDIVTPVYLVGGSVRDTILGKEPKDYDFCTPLSPDEVEAKAKAAGRHVYAIGKKFGTIGFKIEDAPKHYQYVEVTTFRTEVYAPGNRKPAVEFVQDIKEDLSRRDFTINAIAYDGSGYIDPYGGRLDIMARKIKAVGEAKDRFKEDPLRMLRAARFVAQTGFEIDPNLIGKIRAMARTINSVSRERWVQELDKLLVAKHVGRGLLVLKDSYLLKYMLPEVWVVAQNEYLWLNVVQQLQEAPKDADKRWAILLMSIAHPITAEHVLARGKETGMFVDANLIAKEMATGICARLKFSNARREYVLEAVEKQRLI